MLAQAMSQQEDPSLLDYARFHGLAHDHRSNAPLDLVPSLDKNTYQAALEGPQTGCPHSSGSEVGAAFPKDGPVYDVRCTTCLTQKASDCEKNIENERLVIDVGTASMLASISQSINSSPHFDDDDLETRYRRMSKLKHELPLLRTDHDCDVREFHQPFMRDLRDEFLPLETLDEEADEGLTWPSSCLTLPQEIWQSILAEKSEVSADTLQLIYEVTHCEAPIAMLDAECYSNKKTTLAGPPDSPLLPMSPRSRSVISFSDEIGDLESLAATSDPATNGLCKMELESLAEDIVELEVKALDTSQQSSTKRLLESGSLEELFDPYENTQDPQLSPRNQEVVGDSLASEPVLCTVLVMASSPKIDEHTPSLENLSQIIPDSQELFQGSAENILLLDVEDNFTECNESVGTGAEKTVGHERLLTAETVERVAVPQLGFILPSAPWHASPTKLLGHIYGNKIDPLELDIDISELKKAVWPLSSEIERRLRWTPFSVASIDLDLEETIPIDESRSHFWTQPTCLDTDTLTWKPEGLRILDEIKAFDVDELLEGPVSDSQTLECLVRKRRRDLQADSGTSRELHPPISKKVYSQDSLISSMAVNLASLGNFIQTRTRQLQAKARLGLDKGTAATKVAAPISPVRAILQDSDGERVLAASPLQSLLSASRRTMSQDPRLFVVSANFFNDRRLVRLIHKKYMAADFMERDFSLSADLRSNLPTESTTLSKRQGPSPDHDAHMILSPSTGLLWTTLRKVKQRPLPGQAFGSAIQESIKRVARNYEKLIVIIDEDRRPDVGDPNFHVGSVLATDDSEAIAQFTTFCAGLEDETVVLFSSGGVEELSDCIVAMMVVYGLPHSGKRLKHEETPWETFLRRAGMNTYAAQVVLKELYRQNMDHRASHDFGLTAFAKMSEQDRFARFEILLGGKKLLSRMTQVFEGRW